MSISQSTRILLTWLCAFLYSTAAAPSNIGDSFCAALCSSGGQHITCDCNSYGKTATVKRISAESTVSAGCAKHADIPALCVGFSGFTAGTKCTVAYGLSVQKRRTCKLLCYYGMGGYACDCSASSLSKRSQTVSIRSAAEACGALCYYGMGGTACECNASAISKKSAMKRKSWKRNEACGALCFYGMGGSACDCSANALGKRSHTLLKRPGFEACSALCYYGMGGSACDCNASAISKRVVELSKRGGQACRTLCYYGMGGAACNCSASAISKRGTEDEDDVSVDEK